MRSHWQRTLRPQLRALLIRVAVHLGLDVSEKPPPPICKVCGKRHSAPFCYNIEEDETLKKSIREMRQELMSLRSTLWDQKYKANQLFEERKRKSSKDDLMSALTGAKKGAKKKSLKELMAAASAARKKSTT
eukprot:COSAG05_NODE_897_length_6692_cov_5.453966_6_plen_132_part_00